MYTLSISLDVGMTALESSTSAFMLQLTTTATLFAGGRDRFFTRELHKLLDSSALLGPIITMLARRDVHYASWRCCILPILLFLLRSTATG